MESNQVDNFHAGERGWIVSPGPSLEDVTDEQWEIIDKDITFGVSHAVRYHDTKYLVIGEVEPIRDNKFPCYLKSKAEAKFVTEGPQIEPPFPSLRSTHRPQPTGSFSKGLMYCGATAIPALNLALLMGCDPVILLGVDYQTNEHVIEYPGDDPDTLYGVKPDGTNPGKKQFGLFVDYAKSRGQVIINANPDSTLDYFPKVPLREILNV